MGVDPAPRDGSRSRGPFPLAETLDRLLHPAELRRADRVHRHLHGCRASVTLRTHYRQGLQRRALRARGRTEPGGVGGFRARWHHVAGNGNRTSSRPLIPRELGRSDWRSVIRQRASPSPGRDAGLRLRPTRTMGRLDRTQCTHRRRMDGTRRRRRTARAPTLPLPPHGDLGPERVPGPFLIPVAPGGRLQSHREIRRERPACADPRLVSAALR